MQVGRTHRALADQALVADTIARFSDATSRRDLGALGAAFTADAVWEATGDGLAFRYEGAAKIREALAASTKKVTVVFQQIAAPLVTMQSSLRATAQTSVTELLRSEEDGVLRQIFGIYTDELVKEASRWRFAHRRFEMRHQVAMSGGSGP